MPQPPATLFHYTSQAGLLGILGSNEIWATEIRYLNDSSEYFIALDHAVDLIYKDYIHLANKAARRRIEHLLRPIRELENLAICVCSFSEKDDLLSQWRAYASSPGSYSIGLDSKHLSRIAAQQGFTLQKCVYDNKTQTKLVAREVKKALNAQAEISAGATSTRRKGEQIRSAALACSLAIAKLAPVIKSSAFYEEQEWRLISNAAVDLDRLRFRPGQSMLIPYSALQLGTTREQYLRSLTIGPSPHEELAEHATRRLLAHYSVPSVTIQSSVAPYRGW